MTNQINTLLTNFLFDEIVPLDSNDAVTAMNLINDQSVMDTFKLRYLEKNIRVIAKQYKNVHFSKVGALVGIEGNQVETIVTEMIEDGRLDAKIDRPKQLIKFGSLKKYNETLNQWGKGVQNLINRVDECVDLLEREGFVMANAN